MKSEHETDRAFDRTSTREELCEVIDLLCESGNAGLAGITPMRRRKGDGPISSEVLSDDLAFDLHLDEEDDKSSRDEGTDELNETLTDLFANQASWLN